MDEIVSLDDLRAAFQGMVTLPKGNAYLGRGDGSGVIVADVNQRTVWTFTLNQPPVPVPLIDGISILPFIGTHTELEGVRVRLGYPPENPTVLYVTGYDQGEGHASVAGITPQEQHQAAQKYVDVGSLINFRIAPNDPVDGEVRVMPGWYKDDNGNAAFFGGDSTDTLLTAAVAALSSGEHQMAVIYVEIATGDLAIATNTAESGGVNNKTDFDTTTIVEMTIPDGALLCGVVHLYNGQTSVTEDDIYRSADPRIPFDSTGTTGGGGGTTDDSARFIAWRGFR